MYQLPPINTILVNYIQIVFAFAHAAPKAKAAAMLDDHGDCLQQQTQSSSSSSSTSTFFFMEAIMGSRVSFELIAIMLSNKALRAELKTLKAKLKRNIVVNKRGTTVSRTNKTY